MLHWTTSKAMGTDIDIIVDAPERPEAVFALATAIFAEQEARFSRFCPESLLARLNRGDVVRDAAMAEVCRLALEATSATGGLFNPMVLPALRDAGYAESFERVDGGSPTRQPVPDPAGCLHVDGDSVWLECGQIDLGGIVKGWTVDLVVATAGLMVPGLLVNAGGDLRACGCEPGEDGWRVSVTHPVSGEAVWDGVITGALATSSTRRRRWRTDDGNQAHHLIDPRTGLPCESPYMQVSVLADAAWRAEVWAKAVLIGGPARAEQARIAGLELIVEEVACTSDAATTGPFPGTGAGSAR